MNLTIDASLDAYIPKRLKRLQALLSVLPTQSHLALTIDKLRDRAQNALMLDSQSRHSTQHKMIERLLEDLINVGVARTKGRSPKYYYLSGPMSEHDNMHNYNVLAANENEFLDTTDHDKLSTRILDDNSIACSQMAEHSFVKNTPEAKIIECILRESKLEFFYKDSPTSKTFSKFYRKDIIGIIRQGRETFAVAIDATCKTTCFDLKSMTDIGNTDIPNFTHVDEHIIEELLGDTLKRLQSCTKRPIPSNLCRQSNSLNK